MILKSTNLFFLLSLVFGSNLEVVAARTRTSMAKKVIANFHGINSSATDLNSECDFLEEQLNSPESEARYKCYSIEYAEKPFWGLFGKLSIDHGSILHSLERQARRACEVITSNGRTKDGKVTKDSHGRDVNYRRIFSQAEEITLIGHSNGAVIARAVLETCDTNNELGIGNKFKNLILVGGPNRGITFTKTMFENGYDRIVANNRVSHLADRLSDRLSGNAIVSGMKRTMSAFRCPFQWCINSCIPESLSKESSNPVTKCITEAYNKSVRKFLRHPSLFVRGIVYTFLNTALKSGLLNNVGPCGYVYSEDELLDLDHVKALGSLLLGNVRTSEENVTELITELTQRLEILKCRQKRTTFLSKLNNDYCEQYPWNHNSWNECKIRQKNKMKQLDGLLLVQFADDGEVFPAGTSWFGKPMMASQASTVDNASANIHSLPQPAHVKVERSGLIRQRPHSSVAVKMGQKFSILCGTNSVETEVPETSDAQQAIMHLQDPRYKCLLRELRNEWYEDDYLGLKYLHEQGKIKYYLSGANHDRMDQTQTGDKVRSIVAFLKGTFPYRKDLQMYYSDSDCSRHGYIEWHRKRSAALESI